METLYRKVTFEIEQQDHCKTVLIGKNANFIFNPNTRNGEELTDFLSGCEEVPDNEAELRKENEEMKAMLESEKINFAIERIKYLKHKLTKIGMWSYCDQRIFENEIKELLNKK